MVTVIQPRQGNAGTDILSALTALLGQIEANRRAGQESDLLKAKLFEGQGTFEPTTNAPPRSFLDVLFGGGSGPDTVRLGNSAYQFQRYPELGEAGARALGLTRPVTESYAPREHLPLDDTPAGPALPSLPTPSTATTATVSPAIARLRLDPKTVSSITLEQLKDNAHLKREQAAADARKERTKLWLTRKPATVSKYEWLIDGLNSDDDTTRTLAEAELSRLQSPARRVDLGEDRLVTQDQQHRERLDQRLTELDQRIAAAEQLGDKRAQAALERLRERIAARRDDLEFLESGRDSRSELSVAGRRGPGTSDSADMKTDDALAKLKELRARPFFPGQAAEKLDRLEALVGQAQKQERSHVTPAITRELKRLELQLDRAARREGVRPQPQTPLRPPPGRQSATGSRTPAGTLTTSDPGPSPEMLATARKGYEAMTPEEAEADLKATLQEDPTLRSLVSQAKQQAYVTLYPQRPLQLQVAPAPPAAAAPTDAPAPAPSASAPPASPSPAVAASTAPGQKRTASPTAPQTPQAHPMMERLKSYYEGLSDTDLAQEARHLERPERQDALTPYRQQALAQVQEARKTRPQPATPEPPANAMHGKILEHYRSQYQHLSTHELLAEQKRLMDADPLARDVRTSLQLSAITMLLTKRQEPPRTGSPQEDAAP